LKSDNAKVVQTQYTAAVIVHGFVDSLHQISCTNMGLSSSDNNILKVTTRPNLKYII